MTYFLDHSMKIEDCVVDRRISEQLLQFDVGSSLDRRGIPDI